MLGIGRQLARHGVPLIGINQGRLGFITDIPLDQLPRHAARPCWRGEYEEDHRSLMHAQVMRDGALRLRRAGDERRGGQPRRHLRHGGTAGRGRRPFRGQPARRRPDRRHRPPAPPPMRCPPAGRCCIRPPRAGCWCRSRRTRLSNRPIVLPDAAEIAIELVAGRDASANFDMQSLASLLHGDRITVRRSRAPRTLPAPARAGAISTRCARNCTGTRAD